MDEHLNPSARGRYYTAWCPAARAPVQYLANRGVPVAAVLCHVCGVCHPVGSVLRIPLKGAVQASGYKLEDR